MNHTEYLKDKIKQIPELPGIYKMLDSGRNIIYIGKSKCLKKRVQSYFTANPKWEKVTRMVTMIRDIEYIVTDTHLEARLLECSLIKEYQPRFNAQMKNDQRYIYIKIDTYNSYHSLSVVSEREENCYGPFRSKYSISQFINMLKNIYPLTKVGSGYELEYHMFPITMDKNAFELNRSILLELFDYPELISALTTTLQTKLEESANSYRYEMAAIYRDLIRGFSIIKYGLEGYRDLASKKILLTLPIPDGYKLFYVSSGCIKGQRRVPEVTNVIINALILEGDGELTNTAIIPQDEKSGIDYRDILYSEISDLSEDLIMILE